ncbi:TRAP transporter large permease [Marispirochaeta aestuarii]|uniref:TRAP transporter large permease n=1 Tax=Marispirochaeta aestuarii TaxID=1963862 RepID=UPI0029C7C872|nr:TRAP transporter large permease [Marispirochaeta aestuarii]
MTAGTVAAIMFILLIVLIILRVPVSFTLAFAVIPILILTPRVTPLMLLQRMMVQYGSFILLSIPFFLLAAVIMNEAKITDRLIRFSRSMVGPLPGGLGHVNVAVSMLFAGISGSSNADAAGIGSVLIPAMEKEGYDKNFTVAVTACSAVMGNIIPPSITMVVWGGVMSTSVSGLFLAGFVPGVMIALFQMALVLYFALKRGYPRDAGYSLKEFVLSFRGAILALVTPLIIVGGIVFGLVTPTEASLVAVVYSLILGMFIYKTVSFNKFISLMLDTAKLASIVLFAVGCASIYGWVLAYYKIPNFLVGLLGGITTSPSLMLIIFVGIFLLVGTFMDSVPAIVILGPLLAPIAEHVGIHPLHFAIVGVVSLAFGLVTPPYGLCLLISSEIAGINAMRPLKEVGLFLLSMLAVLLLIIFFPSLTLAIPQAFMPELFL